MSEASVIYEFEGRRVDPARRELMHRGRVIPLFPRCFDALVLFIEKRGELLDKDFLLTALWPGVIVEENSLAKVVSELRRALGEGPKASACIATVPKHGYRFVADVTVVLRDSTPPTPRDRAEIRSLAVLPFSIFNPAGGDDVLGVGLADALITRLGQLRRTVVRPTSSVTRHAVADATPAAAGRALDVDAVIAGSVRRVGEQLRVGVQLVSVRDDAVVWAEKFDSQAGSALALEDSIAERVATALTLALMRGESPPTPRRYTTNADAYEHYIRARYFISKRTRASLFQAIDSLERAIAIDGRFALAYAGLSEAWLQLGLRAAVSQSLRPREVMPKARAAAEKALAIDDSLSEAHATLGQVLFTYEWKRDAGLGELRRAIELNPNNQNAQHWLAMAFGGLGEFDVAAERIQRALAIDPLAVIVNANVGFLLYRAGRIDDAIAKLRHTLAMEPAFIMTRYRLALALEARGLFDEAVHQFESMQPSRADPLAFTGIARTYALMGRTEDSRRLLREILEISRDTYVPAATIADVYVALEDHEKALDYLALGVDERAIVAMWMHSERHWDPLRAYPRFQELVARVGLPGKV